MPDVFCQHRLDQGIQDFHFPKETGEYYIPKQADKHGNSGKTQLRKDINIAINSSSTYDEFLLLIRAKGYESKIILYSGANLFLIQAKISASYQSIPVQAHAPDMPYFPPILKTLIYKGLGTLKLKIKDW